jgi:hypothetical protein
MADEKAPALPAKVEAAIAHWESDLIISIGPLISTQAANVLHEQRANLRAQMAAALAAK